MKHYRIFVLFSLITTCQMVSFGWKTAKSNHYLVKCLQNLMLNDNSTFVKNVRISVEADSKLVNLKFGEILDEFLASNNFDVMFEIRNNNTQKSRGFTIHRRIMFVDSFLAFKRLIKLQRSHSTNISGIFQNFYVILQTSIHNLNNVLRQITRFCRENMISDINILVEDAQGSVVTIYSYYPFTPTSCKNSEPVVYNRFKNGSFTWTKPVFPVKLTNLWKCPLNIILYEVAPFVRNVKNPDRIFGVDVSVLNYLAFCMNFTWKTIVTPNRRGMIYSNGTFTHGFKMLHDRLGDLMLSGAVFSSNRISYFVPSRDYFHTNLQLILKPLEKYSSLSILLFPFDHFTWIIILTLFIGKWIIYPVLSKKVLSKFRVRSRRRISSNWAACGWLLSLLIIRSSYEGSIYKFLRKDPCKKLPESLDAAIADGYTFLTTQEIYDFSVSHMADIEESQLRVYKVPIEEIFRIFSKLNGRYALIANAASFTTATNEISTFREIYRQWIVLKKPILMAFTTIYMPRYSFLTSVLNGFIAKMSSNGIADKIERHFSGRIHLSAPTDVPNQLSMQNLLGAFQLLAAMMVIAGFIFLIEMISARNTIIKTLLNVCH